MKRGKKMEKAKIKSIKPHKKTNKFDIYAAIDWEKAAKLFRTSSQHDESVKHVYPPVKKILKALAIAGSVGLIFAFPGAAPAIGSLFLGQKQYNPWKTKHVISRLRKRKLVSTKYNDDGSVTVTLTKDGMLQAITYQLESMKLKKMNKWDNKWRVVIFDIPEKYRKTRDIFRMRLKQLGLTILQESVYVSPYPCFKEIEFLRQLYAISIKVRYLLVEKIEEDEELRSYFELE